MRSKIVECIDGEMDLTGLANPGDQFAVYVQSDETILLVPLEGPKEEKWQ